MRESYPVAEMTVDGRNAQYIVRFDGWIDHAGSELEISSSGKFVATLFRPGTASLISWLSLRRYWRWAVTNFTGMRSPHPMVISRTGGLPSRSPGDFW